jgi:subtilisin family serine protease
MASIAAGIANGVGTVGVAPDAKLLLAQVGSGGTTVGINMAAVLQAMAWADTKGANVINLSLGSTYDANFKAQTVQIAPGIYKAPATYGSMYGNKVSDLTAFATATKSAVIVASAGNSGTGYAQFPGAFATQTDASGNLLLGGRVPLFILENKDDDNGNP